MQATCLTAHQSVRYVRHQRVIIYIQATTFATWVLNLVNLLRALYKNEPPQPEPNRVVSKRSIFRFLPDRSIGKLIKMAFRATVGACMHASLIIMIIFLLN
jgi:hypothetical protein